MGNKDDILEAEKFNDVMMDLVRFALVSRSHIKVPAGLDAVDDINNCIKKTRSGLILGQYLKKCSMYDVSIIRYVCCTMGTM